MISKYCAKIINVWNFSDPIVEVMHSEFSGPSLPSTKGTLRKIWNRKLQKSVTTYSSITYDFTFPVHILRFHWDLFKCIK